MNALQSLTDNYINSNLADARRQAKRHSHKTIRRYLEGTGFHPRAAVAIADFLKNLGTFQEACDAEHAHKL